MIKKLKNKIIIVITVILFLVFAAQIITINIINYQNKNNDAVRSARLIAKKFDMFSSDGDDLSESPGFIYPDGYYVVLFNSSGTATAVFSDGNIEMTKEKLQKYLDIVFRDNKSEGRAFDMFYAVSKNPVGTFVVLTDNSAMKASVGYMVMISIISLTVAAILSFFIAKFIAHQIVSPVERNFEKQKQFISDAGHELKTPLTVIGANADLLESEIGDNKWLEYIRSETSRMNGLVYNLLSLAKIEDTDSDTAVFSEFNLSKTVEGMAMTFESVAYENNIILDADIESGIIFKGNEDEIKQLLSILIDNAIKHSTGDTVTVSLCSAKSKGQYELTVSNFGDEIPENEREKIFERFYRADKSRSRSQNRFGLGLAIAKAITEKHGGKIDVACKNGETSFIVTF